MAQFCLVKSEVEKFKKGLVSGEISPAILAKFTTSEARRDYLAKFVGKENAVQVNGLYESKLLLKNQKAGMISWAKKVAGISKPVKKDIFSKIERLDKVLDPASADAFMEDLVATRLNMNVTADEAKTIFDLSKKLQETDAKRDPETKLFKTEAERLEYGAAKVSMANYVSDLKNSSEKLSVFDRAKPANYSQDISDIAGLAKSLKASFDDSALLRQGWKVLWTNPVIWTKNAAISFSDFARTVKSGDKIIDGIMADLVSRPNYDQMVTAKLAIGNIEESFPTSLPAKVPVLGRFFKGSETAFEGFLYRTRADVFDSYLKIAEKSGVDITDPEELIGIGKVINSLTGRGNLGKLEPVANVVNNVFFSPRFVKSQLDVLTAPFDRQIPKFARKRAAFNLTKIIMGAATVLIIARALDPKAVELDPRSSDFGKIKIKNTRFDVTGGSTALATLTFRLARWSKKSSTTGKVTELNTQVFGSETGLDVVIDFFLNKASPAAAIVRDILRGEDFDGNKPTVTGSINNLLTPLPVSNYLELKNNPNSAPLLLALMADALGVGTNTYGDSKKDWGKNPGAKLTQFKEKVGDTRFKEANDRYNKKYNEWFNATIRKTQYQNLSDDSKQAVIDKAKDKIQQDIFKEYRFKYKEKKTSKSDKKQKKTIDSLLK